MSDFPTRRGVNVSQYIAQLNTVPAADETFDSPPNFEDDLALFTNSEFVNWDGADKFDPAPAPTQGFNMNTFEQPAGTDAQLDLNFNGKCLFVSTSGLILLFFLLCIPMSLSIYYRSSSWSLDAFAASDPFCKSLHF